MYIYIDNRGFVSGQDTNTCQWWEGGCRMKYNMASTIFESGHHGYLSSGVTFSVEKNIQPQNTQHNISYYVLIIHSCIGQKTGSIWHSYRRRYEMILNFRLWVEPECLVGITVLLVLMYIGLVSEVLKGHPSLQVASWVEIVEAVLYIIHDCTGQKTGSGL